MRVTTSSRVQVLLDIPTNDNWGTDCTIDQIEKQSKESVTNILQKLLQGNQSLGIKLISFDRVNITTTVSK